MAESTVFTPILELVTVVALGFLLGLMHYFKEHNMYGSVETIPK